MRSTVYDHYWRDKRVCDSCQILLVDAKGFKREIACFLVLPR